MRLFVFPAAVVLTALSAFAHQANACSMRPVDTAEQARDLQRFLPAALNVEANAITSVEVTAATGNYIWTDPMCPEGLKASATFTVEFKQCKSQVKVSKVQPTGLSKIPVKHQVQIEITPIEKCQEN